MDTEIDTNWQTYRLTDREITDGQMDGETDRLAQTDKPTGMGRQTERLTDRPDEQSDRGRSTEKDKQTTHSWELVSSLSLTLYIII